MVWLFNLYLYFMYVQNPAAYQELVAGGMSCWVQSSTANLPVGEGAGIGGLVQPACWYDPSNTNDGRLKTAPVKEPVSRPGVRMGR
jgi:hypothetical protein